LSLKAKGKLSNKDIVKRLNAKGVRITEKNFRWVISNPFYAGYVTGKLVEGKLINGKHPALVDLETFLKANEVLQLTPCIGVPKLAGLAIKTNINYDHAGRVLTVKKLINDDPATLRTINQNTYDALGQLKNKKIGQKNENGILVDEPIEDQDYAYNIRGWLKGVNWQGYGGTGATLSEVDINSSKWFSMDLSYDWGYDLIQLI